MQVTSAPADPLDRFDVAVDQDAELVDLDEVLAEFLLRLIRRRQSSTAAISADSREGKT